MKNHALKRDTHARSLTLASTVLLLAACALSAGEKKHAPQPLQQAIAAMRQAAAPDAPTPGSLWNPQGRFADLAGDYKASNVNDLITIHIVEQTQAQGAGAVQSQRKLAANSGVTGLFGQVGARSGLQSLLNLHSDQALSGQAQTNSSTRLTTSLSGRVVEVLPNGSLVIEATRMVEMNRECQTVVLRGIVRPGDVSPGNTVLSSAISHLEVELRGRGVISDGTRPPNRIVQTVLRLLGF